MNAGSTTKGHLPVAALRDANKPNAADRTQILIISAVIFTSVAITVPIISWQGQEIQQSFRNLSILVLATVASISSVLAAIKTDKGSSHRRLLLVFSIGIISWLTAEAIWDYYVYVLEVDLPYPSVADVFYLAAYPFVGYFLYKGKKKLYEENQEENKLLAMAITITVVAFIFNIFLLQIVESTIGFSTLTTNDFILLALSIAYPVLDGMLLVPAIIIMYSAIANRSQSFSWILLAASIFATAVADTGFGYTALIGVELLQDNAIWDILYDFMYILIAGAMIFEISISKRTRGAVMKSTPLAGGPR